MEYGVIMAGGAGTRLWPLSRRDHPKQLMVVGDGRSLLRLAYERLAGVVAPERILVCASESHRAAVHADLTELPIENFLGEPVGRDTAAAVGLPATVLVARDPDAVIAVVTADHVIEPVATFHAALSRAFEFAASGPRLVTFGVVPTHLHTGLGYIERGAPLDGGVDAFDVTQFREKPDAATAAGYLASGRHLWNSGMFVWRADTLLAQLRRHLPAAADALAEISAGWAGPERAAVLEQAYARMPAISIDYAVLEPASRADEDVEVVVVPLAVQWLDIGSWPALAGTFGHDADGNALGAPVVLIDSADNIIVAEEPDHLVAAVGLRDMVVVCTRHATLVCPRADAERVKQLVAAARERFGDRYT